jgi:hypothetical protein
LGHAPITNHQVAYNRTVIRFQQYYGQFGGLPNRFRTLPGWARFIVGIAALPGLILACLSILAFGISILALLLLTVPVYSALQKLTGRRVSESPGAVEVSSPGAKRVDATIIE